MGPNPPVRGSLQSEEDIQVSDSLRRLQLDEPAGDDPNSSTLISTLPSTRPKVSIPDQDFQEVCRELERNIQPDDNERSIQRSLDVVWVKVYNALEEDQNLSSRRADQKEFKENLKNYGEKRFIDLLREMAKKKNWRDLLEHGTSFLASDFEPSYHVLSPGVFFKHPLSDKSSPPQPEWTEASINGPQSS